MNRKLVLYSAFMIGMSACSSAGKNVQFLATDDLRIEGGPKEGTQAVEKYEIKKGEAFSFRHPVSQVAAEGRVPVIVVSSDVVGSESKETPWRLVLPDVKSWKSTETDQYVSQEMDQLYIGLLDIMEQARSRKIDSAFGRINAIIERYPKLAAAYYIRAQLEVMSGSKAKALQSLETAISIRNGFEEAVILKNQLLGAGGKR